MQKKEFAVLTLLEQSEEALTQRQITAELGFSVGSVNKIVKKLTDEGLIANGRITPAGVEALEPYRVKRAIFLAAGFGSRMVPLTFNTPKPLVRVHGTRMIDTLLDAVVAAGIPEVIIVRGYLGEQFDQLLYKYPMIKFMENPIYNEANNISSALVARYLMQNAYVLEADLVLSNPKLIRKYEYSSNFMGIPVEVSDDWCLFTDKNGIVIKQAVLLFITIIQNTHAQLHTFVANANTGSGDKAFCLGLAFSAERTMKTTIFLIRHESVTAFPID